MKCAFFSIMVAILLLAATSMGEQKQYKQEDYVWFTQQVLDEGLKRLAQKSEEWLKEALQRLTARGPLTGMVVVLDPGHGGADPGSNGIFQGKRVHESGYVYDVSLRVRDLAEKLGARVYLTILDGKAPRNLTAQELIPANSQARFAIDKTRVRAGTPGLSRRIRYGNQILANNPRAKVVWISVHFDVTGRRDEVKGVRVVTPNLKLDLAQEIVESFTDDRRQREDMPIVANGDKEHGLRNLYVLGKANRIEQKVLIELGNFLNITDVWRIRAWPIRQAYATAIVRALVEMM